MLHGDKNIKILILIYVLIFKYKLFIYYKNGMIILQIQNMSESERYVCPIVRLKKKLRLVVCIDSQTRVKQSEANFSFN